MSKSYTKILAICSIVMIGFVLWNTLMKTDQTVEIKKHITATTPDGLISHEDPGLFYEALARIKTTKSGETYTAGYLSRELQKAEANLQRARRHSATLDWVERGPVNISGRARAIIVDPSDATKNTWWQASIGGGVWKTTDAGQTWENKTPNLLTLTTATMAICRSNPDVMYVGTGMGYGRIVDLAGSGIWKSTDHGETWHQLESTANGELLDAINRIVVDPGNPDIVLACANGHTSHLGPKSDANGTFGSERKSGIFRSADGGATWTQVFDADVEVDPNRDNRVQQIIADPNDFSVLYASVNEIGVIKSTDKGLTWSLTAGQFTRQQHIGVPQRGGFGLSGISSRAELAISPSNPQRIYAAVERPISEPPDLYMSKDAGFSWVEVPDTGNDPSWFDSNGGLGRNSAWFNNTIVVHPYDPDIVFVGGVNIYRLNIDANNNTRTSTPVAWWIGNNQGIPVVHADHHWLEVIPVDASSQSFKLLCANDGGYCVSEDGGASWTQFGGTVTTQFYGVDKKPGENVYIGGLQDNSTLVSGADPDNQSTWTTVIGGDGIEVVWNYKNPLEVIGCSQGGNLNKSYDGGVTFSALNQAKVNFQNGPFLTKIANSKSDPDLLFVVGDGGVNRSDDFGETWSTTTVPGNWLGFRPFDNVEVSLADPRVVWISSRLDVDPAAGVSGGIYRSTDGGLNFIDISINFPNSVTESSGIATHPDKAGTSYFLFAEPGNPKILQTNDFGQTWEDISGFSDNSSGRFNDRGFPDVAVFSLLVMPYDDKVLWAGTEIGLFISEDGGASWFLSNNGLPHVGIFQMSIVDEQIIVATQGRGVWTVEIPELKGHQPKDVPLVPRIGNLAMLPSNQYVISLDLRSTYDSTDLFIDDVLAFKFDANNNSETISKFFTPDGDKQINVRAVSYVDGDPYISGTKTLSIFDASAAKAFTTNFEKSEEIARFSLNSFGIRSESGFSSAAAHTSHPYGNASNAVLLLKSPIIVAEQDATIRYKDVALVEPGAGNVTDHTDPNFFDFVIVEGSKDGISWQPLAPGYDARLNSNWLAAYNGSLVGQNSTATGSASLFMQQSINMLNTFAANDTIFVRFRLSSDPFAFGWGWVIDDLRIQSADDPGGEEVTSLSDEELEAFSTYPNPFKQDFAMTYGKVGTSDLKVEISNMRGQVVDEWLIRKRDQTGQFEYQGAHLVPGMYLLRVSGVDWSKSFKIIKEK